jgi:hypothetical protein
MMKRPADSSSDVQRTPTKKVSKEAVLTPDKDVASNLEHQEVGCPMGVLLFQRLRKGVLRSGVQMRVLVVGVCMHSMLFET